MLRFMSLSAGPSAGPIVSIISVLHPEFCVEQSTAAGVDSGNTLYPTSQLCDGSAPQQFQVWTDQTIRSATNSLMCLFAYWDVALVLRCSTNPDGSPSAGSVWNIPLPSSAGDLTAVMSAGVGNFGVRGGFYVPGSLLMSRPSTTLTAWTLAPFTLSRTMPVCSGASICASSSSRTIGDTTMCCLSGASISCSTRTTGTLNQATSTTSCSCPSGPQTCPSPPAAMTYVWAVGQCGACSQTCGTGGVRQCALVYCRASDSPINPDGSGVAVSASVCSDFGSIPPPSATQACPTLPACNSPMPPPPPTPAPTPVPVPVSGGSSTGEGLSSAASPVASIIHADISLTLLLAIALMGTSVVLLV